MTDIRIPLSSTSFKQEASPSPEAPPIPVKRSWREEDYSNHLENRITGLVEPILEDLADPAVLREIHLQGEIAFRKSIKDNANNYRNEIKKNPQNLRFINEKYDQIYKTARNNAISQYIEAKCRMLIETKIKRLPDQFMGIKEPDKDKIIDSIYSNLQEYVEVRDIDIAKISSNVSRIINAAQTALKPVLRQNLS